MKNFDQQNLSSKNEFGKSMSALVCKVILLFALFAFFSIHSFAVTYYSRTSGGNWNVNATWSTVAYGNATNTATYPKAGDIANIGNGYTIFITSNSACATLNLGQGASGILEFKSVTNYSLTVTGNITVNTGAIFRYNTAVVRTHSLFAGGNITNFGTVDFYVGANQIVNITFNTATNSIVTGTGTWDLNNVTMLKTTSTATLLDVRTVNFENATRNLILTYGTYLHNNAGAFNVTPVASTFTIGPNVIVKVPTGTMWFASAADNLIIQGKLYVNGGTVKAGSTAGLQGIRSDRNGLMTPDLEVSAGTLLVYGGITYGGGSANEPFSFRMTGGNVSLMSGTTLSAGQSFCVNDFAGSIFFMSAGTITLQNPNTSAGAATDFQVCGTNGTVTSTGGLVTFGNLLTPTGKIFNFRPYANVIQPNIKITGTPGAAITLATSTASTANFKLLSLYIDIGKTFDIRSITGAAGDNKQMTLTGVANATLDAIYNNGTFVQRQSTVTFNTAGAQCIGGLNVTTFYILAINNASNITLNKAANVSSFLSMVNGKLITTNANILTCNSAANASLGTNSTYVDGPMVHTIATGAAITKTYPVGKGIAFRPVVLTIKHSNFTSVTYRAEVMNAPASALPYTKPATIANVSAVRYVKFTRQAVANFTNGRIQMYYDMDDVVLDKNTLLVAHDDGVSMWQNFGGVATANVTGNILSTTFNNFHSFFTLGNPPGGGNPLPVTLSSFTAQPINHVVNVNWTTASEINNNYFTIERSVDNVNYTPIVNVEGAGNSTTTHSYSTVDDSPLKGTSYYRLKQTDFDGTSQIFTPVSVYIGNKGSFEVFPSVSDGSNVHLRYTESDMKNFSVSVSDITGKIIPSTVIYEEMQMQLIIEDKYKIPGIYLVSASNGKETVKNKFMITKN